MFNNLFEFIFANYLIRNEKYRQDTRDNKKGKILLKLLSFKCFFFM